MTTATACPHCGGPTANSNRHAKADAFIEAADHLDQLADLADGPNAGIIALALKPAALAFRMRAAAELGAADESEGGGQS